MYLQHLRGVQRTEGPKNISEEEAEKLHQVKQFATSRELTMQPVTHADYDLLVLFPRGPNCGDQRIDRPAQGSADDHSATERKSHANTKTRRPGFNLNISTALVTPPTEFVTPWSHAAQASRTSQLAVGSGSDGRMRPGDLTIAEARTSGKGPFWSLGQSAPWFLGPMF